MNVTNVIIELEVAADTFINLYTCTKLYKIRLHSQNRHHSQPVQLTTSISTSEPAVDFPWWCFCWIMCPVWILSEWLLLEDEPVPSLSLSSCVADSEIRLHKYTWQHQKQLCVFVHSETFLKPTCRRYLHIAVKVKLSLLLALNFILSCLFHLKFFLLSEFF